MLGDVCICFRHPHFVRVVVEAENRLRAIPVGIVGYGFTVHEDNRLSGYADGMQRDAAVVLRENWIHFSGAILVLPNDNADQPRTRRRTR